MVNNHPIWKFQLSHLFSLGIEIKVNEFGSIETLVLSIKQCQAKQDLEIVDSDTWLY